MTKPRTSTPELLATCWTSAGDTMPARNGDRSPLDIEHRVRAVAAAGFRGFGVNHADLAAARDGIGLRNLAALLQELGITHVEVEAIDHWWTEGEQRVHSDRVRADLLDAAAELGARQVKVGVGTEEDSYDPAVLRASFAALADEAAAAGTRIALEPCVFSSMPTLHPAVGLVTDVAHPNAGLLLDIWHIQRSGLDYQDMAELVPAEYVFAIELNDGPAKATGPGLEDTFDNRLPCGEGDFDVVSFIRAVDTWGFTGPWGVEIMSEYHRTLDVETATKRAYDTALNCLARARASGAGS